MSIRIVGFHEVRCRELAHQGLVPSETPCVTWTRTVMAAWTEARCRDRGCWEFESWRNVPRTWFQNEASWIVRSRKWAAWESKMANSSLEAFSWFKRLILAVRRRGWWTRKSSRLPSGHHWFMVTHCSIYSFKGKAGKPWFAWTFASEKDGLLFLP